MRKLNTKEANNSNEIEWDRDSLLENEIEKKERQRKPRANERVQRKMAKCWCQKEISK